MTAEARPALREAIKIAPVDPLCDGRVTNLTRDVVIGWKRARPQFGTLYDQTLNELGLTLQEKDALHLYLAATAFTLASFSPNYPETTARTHVEARAGTVLFKHLVSPDSPNEQAAYKRTWQTLYSQQSALLYPTVSPQSEPREELPREANADHENLLRNKMKELIDATLGQELNMRGVRSIVDQLHRYCVAIGYEDPPIFDLSLGDVNLTGEMEAGFEDVPEAMGVAGLKLERIRRRATEYEELLRRADANPYGYDTRAVGWMALRDRFEAYLNFFGLNSYIRGGENYINGGDEIDGSYVAYGGSDGMERAYLIAQQTLRDERKDQTYVPTIAFFTPGFMMMRQVAENCGLKTKQLITRPDEHFLPTAKQLREFLEQNQEVDLVVLTPINNPGSHVAEAERITTLLTVLKEYEQKGRKIILINDLAYLGTGDRQANMNLGKALNVFKRRIDVLPLTKIGGETGLRCCVGMTPDFDLAKRVEKVTKTKTLAISYAMQVRALAKLDFIGMEDMRRLMDLYKHRQARLTQVLQSRPDLFDTENIFVGGEGDNSWGNSALYLWVPLRDSVDPKAVMKLGFFGTPPAAFYYPGTTDVSNYIRFALGVVPMTERTIERMKIALAANPS